jgi:thioredoxin-dependent peroxiredoxin
MKWSLIVGATALAAVMAGSLTASAGEGEPLKVGDKAPDFKLVGTDGKQYTLSQFRGKSTVVIAWYPKAATPG